MMAVKFFMNSQSKRNLYGGLGWNKQECNLHICDGSVSGKTAVNRVKE